MKDGRFTNEGHCIGRGIVFLRCASSSAQTLDDLKQDGNGGSTDNILTYGMGYHQHRYSPLKQIDKQTVKRLVPVWKFRVSTTIGASRPSRSSTTA